MCLPSCIPLLLRGYTRLAYLDRSYGFFFQFQFSPLLGRVSSFSSLTFFLCVLYFSFLLVTIFVFQSNPLVTNSLRSNSLSHGASIPLESILHEFIRRVTRFCFTPNRPISFETRQFSALYFFFYARLRNSASIYHAIRRDEL